MHDVIIVGGGAAGLSMALTLGRACRDVLIIDGGEPRNAPAAGVHGYLTRDGIPPLELRAIGRKELEHYPNVTVQSGVVVDAFAQENGFEIALDDGNHYTTRKLALATGIRDELPAIEGFEQFWGRGIYHCPYCFGWEVRQQPLALYGKENLGLELATVIRGWSNVLTLCTDGFSEYTDEERNLLQRMGVHLREEPIERIEGNAGGLERVVFRSGEPLSCRGLFLRPQQQQKSLLAEKLGCEFQQEGYGKGLVKVNENGLTSVPGVYAVGDLAGLHQHVIGAASAGAWAAAMINYALLKESIPS